MKLHLTVICLLFSTLAPTSTSRAAVTAASSQPRLEARSARPLPVPIGPPIAQDFLRASDLIFNEQRPSRATIGPMRAIRVALQYLPGLDAQAYIAAARLGRVRRTRSPIPPWSNRRVWIVAVSDASTRGAPCALPPTVGSQEIVTYEVVDARSAERLFYFCGG